MKCWTTNFNIHARECPVFIMNQLKSVYNIPFLDPNSHPIHTCLSMIASNGMSFQIFKRQTDENEKITTVFKCLWGKRHDILPPHNSKHNYKSANCFCDKDLKEKQIKSYWSQQIRLSL